MVGIQVETVQAQLVEPPMEVAAEHPLREKANAVADRQGDVGMPGELDRDLYRRIAGPDDDHALAAKGVGVAVIG